MASIEQNTGTTEQLDYKDSQLLISVEKHDGKKYAVLQSVWYPSDDGEHYDLYDFRGTDFDEDAWPYPIELGDSPLDPMAYEFTDDDDWVWEAEDINTTFCVQDDGTVDAWGYVSDRRGLKSIDAAYKRCFIQRPLKSVGWGSLNADTPCGLHLRGE